MNSGFLGFLICFGMNTILFALLASTVFWMWMIVDCATRSPMGVGRKLILVFVLFLTGIIGATIYYFKRRPKRTRRILVVAVLADFAFFATVFGAFVYFSPDKNQITQHAQTEWSREFRKIGLADAPRNAKYHLSSYVDGRYGHWSFRADVQTVDEWLNDSQSIKRALKKQDRGTRRYLMTGLPSDKECLVVVASRGGESWVRIETIDLTLSKRASATDRQRSANASESLHEEFERVPNWRLPKE
jgi:hypothetical protein